MSGKNSSMSNSLTHAELAVTLLTSSVKEAIVIVRMGLLQKRADQEVAEFRRHWREGHGPVASKLKGLRRYHQNHVVNRDQLGVKYDRGGNDFDGISQLWFDDVPSMQRAFSGDYMKTLIEDEARFIGDLKLITALPHVVIPTPKGMPLIKRISTLKRRPDVSTETFKNEWFDVHSFLVKRMPQVKGYTQNLAFDRAYGRTKPATPAMYDEMPIDGIVELWFSSVADLEAAFASDAGRTCLSHGAEFISEVATFLVETLEVV
jgi:uncharacterized protein (TIGR02118 family)